MQALFRLQENKIVTIETDTVWGFVVSPKSVKAYNNLIEYKNRQRNKKFPLLLYDNCLLFKILKKSPALLLLSSIYLPGPLTIVGQSCKSVPLYMKDEKEKIAIRVPNVPAPIHLIKAFGYLVSTSANISNSELSNNIEKISQQFDNSKLFVLSDNTIIEKRKSSTVVEIDNGTLIIHRIGSINPFDINYRTNLRLKFNSNQKIKILFVCSGNTCRSPVAEFIAKKITKKNLSIDSAGTDIKKNKNTLSDNMKKIIKNKYNIDYLHQSKQITEKLISWADIILVMEKKHKELVIKKGGLKKTFLLSIYDKNKREISDPWEKDYNFYNETFNIIENSVKQFLNSFDQK